MRKNLPVLGMMLALALVLSYVESLLPVPFGVPGMKIGLSNLIVVVLMYRASAKEALLVNLLRIALSGFLFGGLSAILFSLAGALLSFTGMALLKRTGRFGIPGVSVAGGVLHNAGQLAVAAFTVRTYRLLFFIAPLLLTGALTGFALGLVAYRLLTLSEKKRK